MRVGMVTRQARRGCALPHADRHVASVALKASSPHDTSTPVADTSTLNFCLCRDLRTPWPSCISTPLALTSYAPSPQQDVIEPVLKPQWWVNCKDMAAKSCQAVRDGTLEIIPKVRDAWGTCMAVLCITVCVC